MIKEAKSFDNTIFFFHIIHIVPPICSCSQLFVPQSCSHSQIAVPKILKPFGKRFQTSKMKDFSFILAYQYFFCGAKETKDLEIGNFEGGNRRVLPSARAKNPQFELKSEILVLTFVFFAYFFKVSRKKPVLTGFWRKRIGDSLKNKGVRPCVILSFVKIFRRKYGIRSTNQNLLAEVPSQRKSPLAVRCVLTSFALYVVNVQPSCTVCRQGYVKPVRKLLLEPKSGPS